MHVLVVAELEPLQMIIGAYLKIAGFEPHETGDPKQGLFLCNHFKFLLAVLDYELPRINGLRLLNSIRKNQDNVPAIIMTSNPLLLEVPKNSIILHKPFSMEAFKEAVASLGIKKEAY